MRIFYGGLGHIIIYLVKKLKTEAQIPKTKTPQLLFTSSSIQTKCLTLYFASRITGWVDYYMPLSEHNHSTQTLR